MLILIAFAFVAGVVTILSPCILPILPVVLSGSVGGGRKRPLGIIVGFIGSFSFFTLFLTTIVQLTGISATALRTVAVAALIAFGLVLLVPPLQQLFERLLSAPLNRLPQKSNGTGETSGRADFMSGIIVGISTGLIWTPCVGPILASVIALALTGTVTGLGALVTLSYAAGAAIPLLAIAFGGRELLRRVPWLLAKTGHIQKAFGIILIATAVAIHFNADRKLQVYLARAIPAYGAGLAHIEDNAAVKDALASLNDNARPKAHEAGHLPDMGDAPELVPGGKWFNSKPLTLKGLRGKVVLVDFWTYTCINCIRTLPALKAWNDRYKDKGLVIVGVHTPEFEFEKDAKNLERAIRSEGIDYPVMQDNEYNTWRAYSNRYWPAKYLIDANGRIRYTHFGEGDDDETERAIQSLLSEAGARIDEAPHNRTYSISALTPELYLGYARMQALRSPEPVRRDRQGNYTAPQHLPMNAFAFKGAWVITSEYAEAEVGASLILRFNAKNVFLVMGSEGGPATIEASLDGKTPGEAAGSDVKDGRLELKEQRLYRLIDLPRRGKHTLKLRFLDSKARLFAFTFG